VAASVAAAFPPAEPLCAISEQAARDLLAEAQARLGRPAMRKAYLGPRSLGPAARFVVDHAPWRVLLVWPDAAPSTATIPLQLRPGTKWEHPRRGRSHVLGLDRVPMN
jgi:hypothetical protein